MAITARAAQRCLVSLIEQVNDDRTPVEIIARSGSAVLLSRTDYELLEKTARHPHGLGFASAL